MTREQAIESLSWLKTRLSVGLGGMDKLSPHYKDMVDEVQSIALAIAALREKAERERALDPDTGLVPCGCGERVSIAFYPAWAGKPDLYQVDCFSCHVGTRPCQTAEQAKAAWNTAMGHKGGAE